MKLRIECAVENLQGSQGKNATYKPPDKQNERIELSSKVLRDLI